jgi:uncharacterized protein YaeQ
VALKATIFKADVTVSDIDRQYYATHALTLARHPSETDERMMVRLLAYALHAHERLAFGKGLSDEDEPALLQTDLTGAIELWIDVGEPDEKRLRRARGRARQVVVYSYGGAGAWHTGIAALAARTQNLSVHRIPREASRAMAALAARTMALTYTVQDGGVWVSDGARDVQVVFE